MILPVATSKLANKHLVPWRLYSCSWRSIVAWSHRQRGMKAFKRLDESSSRRYSLDEPPLRAARALGRNARKLC